MGAKKKLKQLLPYWLFGHEQTCAACGHKHAHAVTERCVACDEPHCPVCVVHVDGEVFCETCQPQQGGKTKWRRARSGKA